MLTRSPSAGRSPLRLAADLAAETPKGTKGIEQKRQVPATKLAGLLLFPDTDFDNALLSHADRIRIIAEKHREALFKDPQMRGVLLDGFARATWKTERSRGQATLVIDPFEPLPERDRTALAEEAPVCSPLPRRTSTTATFDWSGTTDRRVGPCRRAAAAVPI